MSVRILAAIVAAALALTACASPSESRFRVACSERGGFVAVTENSFWAYRIDCIVDNEIIYLPGFA